MRATTSTARRALPALLAAAVVSIVLGIIGMHALSTHGVMTHTDPSATDMTRTSPMSDSMTGAHGDDLAAAASHTAGTLGVEGAATVPPNGGNGTGDMVMLCVAMLASATGALLLLLVGLRRVPRLWAHLPAAPTTVTGWVTARLGAGPPAVWEFSVIRC